MTESTVLTLTASGLLPKSARSFGLHCSWVASNNLSLQVVLVVRLVVALGALRLLLYFPIPVLLNMLFTFSDASCGEVALIVPDKGGERAAFAPLLKALLQSTKAFRHGLFRTLEDWGEEEDILSCAIGSWRLNGKGSRPRI